MNPRVRILIVDDHALFRESLARLLDAEPDLCVAGRCATVCEAQQVLATAEVDVILLDYDLGSDSPIDLLRDLLAHGQAAKVLFVTAGMRQSVAVKLLESGISGIMLKHGGPGQLLEAIHRVASGGVFLDRKVIQSASIDSAFESNRTSGIRSMTDRQREVLSGILDGLTNKEIATKLDVSESSIKAVIQELFHKTGVRTRSQLVRFALENPKLNQ
jgi:two-component system, NarL family, nitrate/nitrite response regulator NarL